MTAILAWGLLSAYSLLCRHPRVPGTRALLLWSLGRARKDGSAATVSPLAAADAEAVRRAARVAPGPAPTCLPRALALQRVLALRGLPSRVRLGLRRTAGGLDGHAWVECGGRPVGEDPARIASYVVCETS